MNEKVQRKSNIVIHGTGSSHGGVVDVVRVHGVGTVGDDLDCREMHVHGQARFGGAVKAERGKVHGTCDVDGSIQAEELVVNGQITVHGDCSAETFRVRGAFQIDGLLNGDRIELTQYGPSFAKEIGGESITVRHEKVFFFSKHKSLHADVIEGDDISLEYTKAKVVRGGRIEIGRGCEIQLVEYSESLKQAKDAVVVEQRRSPLGGGQG
ncbi:MAG: hypothetical protein K6T78_15670 [Alicyclobacillus sp.]|nr:hypothetical protein [Alicyclobacillus sp.]